MSFPDVSAFRLHQSTLVNGRKAAAMMKPVGRLSNDIQLMRLSLSKPYCTFPNDKATPASVELQLKCSLITETVAIQFFEPEVLVSRRNFAKATAMAVPKTAMDVYQCPEFWQDDVWLSGDVFGMKSKADSKSVEPFTQEYFWKRIFCPNSGHHAGASCFIDYVCQFVL